MSRQAIVNRVAAEKLEIEASRSGETVILANMQDLRKIRVQGMVGHAVNELLYDELALTPASGVPSDEMRLEISLESFIGMDPDHIFLQKNRNQTAEELMTSLGTDPLISNMKAFQNGHIYIVDDMLTKSWGIQGRSSLVEVIEEALTQ